MTVLIENYRGKRLFIEDVIADLHKRIAALERAAAPTELIDCPRCRAPLHYTECSNCGFDTTQHARAAAKGESDE